MTMKKAFTAIRSLARKIRREGVLARLARIDRQLATIRRRHGLDR